MDTHLAEEEEAAPPGLGANLPGRAASLTSRPEQSSLLSGRGPVGRPAPHPTHTHTHSDTGTHTQGRRCTRARSQTRHAPLHTRRTHSPDKAFIGGLISARNLGRIFCRTKSAFGGDLPPLPHSPTLPRSPSFGSACTALARSSRPRILPGLMLAICVPVYTAVVVQT